MQALSPGTQRKLATPGRDNIDISIYVDIVKHMPGKPSSEQFRPPAEAPETGQTAALLERADRVLVSLGEGETLPQLDGPSVIPILAQAGEAADSWAVLTAQP